MSPEQARGARRRRAHGHLLLRLRPVRDAERSTRTFAGEERSRGAVARAAERPGLDAPAVERAARPGPAAASCLEKDPRQRRQSAGDVRIDLDWVREEPAAAAATLERRWLAYLSRLAGLAVAIAAIAALAVPAVTHLREAPLSELRLQIVTPPTLHADDFALSPDGRSVVFAALDSSDGVSRLYLRPLDQSDARALAGTDRARLPFWSPDSRSVGFFASEEALPGRYRGRSAAGAGGGQQSLGGAWNADGTILFGRGDASPLFRVPAEGGEAVAATQLEAPHQTGHARPFFLPGGRRFLFRSGGSDPEAHRHLPGIARRRSAEAFDRGRERAAFRAPDRLVYVQQGALLERRFDPAGGVLTGDPVTLATSVGAFSVSASGIVAYRAPQAARSELGWFDRSGNLLQPMPEVWFNGPELSPDERRSGVRDAPTAGNRDVWLLDLARNAPLRFTTNSAIDGYPLWSPDGSQIAFHSNRTAPSTSGSSRRAERAPKSRWSNSPTISGRSTGRTTVDICSMRAPTRETAGTCLRCP